MEINDNELITWLREHYSEIKFLNFKVHNRIPIQNKRFREDIEKLNPNLPIYRQKDLLLKIWEHLIGSSIVFLKSKDKRERYHEDEDYGVKNLSNYFKAYSDFESLFYGADKHYRDHVSHMFMVFLLGHRLLKENGLYDCIRIGDSSLDDDFRISNDEKEAIWCIISLTHDLGYGMSKLPKINSKSRKMLEKYDIFDIQELGFTTSNQLNKFVIDYISADLRDFDKKIKALNEKKYINHIQSKYYLKFLNSYEKFGHGIFSCILLMKNLVYFLESDFSTTPIKTLNRLDARNFLIRNTILRSIASHDCDDIYYLTLPQFPFLLTIFDEMQDWGRPGLSDLFEYKPHKKIIINNLDESQISYTLEFSDPKKHINMAEKTEVCAFISDTFERKCMKFRKILRGAVGGQDRKLKLEFEIVDMISSPNKRYKIIHENPKKVSLLIDGKSLTWHQYITKSG